MSAITVTSLMNLDILSSDPAELSFVQNSRDLFPGVVLSHDHPVLPVCQLLRAMVNHISKPDHITYSHTSRSCVEIVLALAVFLVSLPLWWERVLMRA